MLRVLKILEMAWLLIGIFSVVAGVYFFNQHGWDSSKWFFGGALISGIFFAFRRRQRLKFEQSEKETKSS